MFQQVVNPDNYVFTVYSLPVLFVGLAITLLGIFVLLWERATRVSAAFLLVCLCPGLFFLTTSLNYASRDAGLSLFLSKLGNLGVIFIPISILFITTLLFGLMQRYRSVIIAGLLLSLLFVFGLFFSDLFIRRIEHYSWGWYALYGPLGYAFICYFLAVMVLILRLFVREYLHCTTGRQKKRYRGLLVAFIGGYIGAVDFLPALGISVYPFGYIPVCIFISMCAYVVLRYHLVDITPELAAGQILETMQGAVIVVDQDDRIRLVNPVARQILGHRHEDILGRDLDTVINLPQVLHSRIKTGEPFSAHELSWNTANGRNITVNLSASPLKDGSGTVLGFVFVAHDITERKQAEEAVQESEDRFRTLALASFEGVVISQNGIIMDCNEQMTGIVGYSKEELIDMPIKELVPPESQESVMNTIRTSRDSIIEHELVRKDGSRRIVEAHGQTMSLRGEQSRITAIRDITARRITEEALRNSEALLKAVIESSADAIFVKDLQGRYVLMNKAWSALTGRAPEEVRGKDDSVLFPPAEAEKVMADDRRIARSLSSVIYENTLTMQGEKKSFQVRKGPIVDESRHVTGIYGISRDITEHKQFVDAMRSSEARFRTITENATDGIMVSDAGSMQIRYANPVICTMLGYSVPELCGLRLTDLIAGDGRDQFQASMKAPRAEKGHASEQVLLRKDGSSIRMSISDVHMEIDGRQSLVGFFTDITERYLLEEERLKTQKLDAIGTLAGGIAHDFNNLLQGVFGYISLAKLDISEPAKSSKSLDEAEKALHLAVRLTNQLLTFSKGGKPVKKMTSLGPVIESAAKFALSGSRTGCQITSDDSLWQTDADEGQIGQVIQNIVLNADQSMPEGGQVLISAKNIQRSERKLPPNLPDGRYVQITIQDAGIGIPEQYLTKIFDPYFTTKEKGSGLGLATSYSIIRNHNGMIDVQSVVGHGTTFSIYLPAAAVSTEAKRAGPPIVARAFRAARVLVMDDEQVIRDIAGKMVTALGHRVELAEHGEEALEKYREAKRSGNPFNVVIFDLTIRAGMGGVEAVRMIREEDPAVLAIASSGYSDDETISRHREQGFSAFLKKPYNVRALRDVLNSLL